MMRKLLAAVFIVAALPASAADLPTKAPAFISPPAPFSWTGIYVGGDIGYGWGRSDGTLTNASGVTHIPYSFDPNGVIGGGFIGANYQIDHFVMGVEADWQAANIKGSGSSPFAGVTFGFETKVNNYGSLRGRLGYAADRWLIFATGGWAWGHASTSYTVIEFPPPFFTNSINAKGWTLGGGVEYALTNNWLVRAEFRHTDLGSHSWLNTGVNAGEIGNRITIDDARLGVAYKFW